MTIRKVRCRCELAVEDRSIQVEITDILSPVKVSSVAIESACFSQDTEEDLRYMRGVLDLLKLPFDLRVMGYVQFLDFLVKEGFL